MTGQPAIGAAGFADAPIFRGRLLRPPLSYLSGRMKILSTVACRRVPAALLMLVCSIQLARADDDAIIPDRPNVANSSKAVGHGRVQLEIGANWDRERSDERHVRTLSTPALLRIGMGETTELRVETDGRSIGHERDPATGAHTTNAGWAATSIGFKWHFADAKGALPSLGLIGTVMLPTGSRALRGDGLLPHVALSSEWRLADDWSLALTPGAGRDWDDDGARYGYGMLAASLGKKFTERTQGFLEVAAPQIASASHGGTQKQVDVGVSWLLNKNCQVDAMVVHGLNGKTPDLSLAFGLSVRR